MATNKTNSIKILVLYPFSNHNDTIDGLCSNLNKRGISATSFNVTAWRIRPGNDTGIPSFVRILSIIGLIPKIRGIISNIFRIKAIMMLAKKCDLADIHFFDPLYDRVIEELASIGIKVKVTIWGSDFYRVSKERLERQREIYKNVDIIQIETRQIADDFLKVFPELRQKIRLAHFGLFQFDFIDDLLGKAAPTDYRKKLGIPADKIVLTCGTNRSEGHQHLLIFQNIERLTSEIKERLFLILPMTYGGDKRYIDPVRKKADSLGIPYRIFPYFITKHENGILRIISDILLTVQVTDALSSTIQEYMYAGNIFIAGDWLPYGILNENDIFYLTVTKENLVETLIETMQNFESIKSLCKDNKEKLARMSSWDEEIKEWIAIYNEFGN